MSFKVVSMCVAACFLASAVHGAVPGRARRAIHKDYSNPTLYSQEQFEKGEDGKFYLKKSAHRADSEVDYAEGGKEAVAAKKDMLENMAESGEGKEEEFAKGKEDPAIEEVAAKSAGERKETELKAVEPKIPPPPKPDSKDEVPTEPRLPVLDEEKQSKKKVSIGEIPELYHRLMQMPNFGLPMIIPIRQITYRKMSIMPVAPAEDVSDRLPFGAEDVLAEGEAESSAFEESEKRKGDDNPWSSGPAASIPGILKEALNLDRVEAGEKSKLMDFFGQKFLMRSNVMKVPAGDRSHIFIRTTSVQPVEKVDPQVLKDVLKSKGDEGELEDAEAKEISGKESEMMKGEEAEGAAAKDEKEAEVLKAEATLVKEKVLPPVVVEDVVPGGIVRIAEEVRKMEEAGGEPQLAYALAEPMESFASAQEPMAVPEPVEVMLEFRVKDLKSGAQTKTVEGGLEAAPAEEGVGVTGGAAGWKKDAEISSKGEAYFMDKKRKEKEVKILEESEKSMKKKDKKKKKCTCEEESDSDDD